jgi:DNA-directed RNA polymerase specialized sigma24 family protein
VLDGVSEAMLNPNHSPHPGGAAQEPVQSGDGWLDAELARFEGSRESNELARLAADIELRDRMMLSQYAGPAWERFARACVAYAHPILYSWVRKGSITGLSHRKGAHGAPRSLPRMAAENGSDLVQALLGDAIVKFREKVLIPGLWNPSRGASLKTFFVGMCLLQFPDTLRAWRRQHEARLPVFAGRVDFDELESSARSADEGWLDLGRRVHASLATTDDALRRILERRAVESEYAEIAVDLEMNVNTVKTRIRRFRLGAAHD